MPASIDVDSDHDEADKEECPGWENGAAGRLEPCGGSPQKRLRIAPAVVAAPAAVVCTSVEAVYMVPAGRERAVVTLTAAVIDLGFFKTLNGSKKGNVRHVIPMVLASSGMAIATSLWSPVAEKCAESLQKAMEQADFPYVEVSHLERVEVPSTCGTVFKLQSTKATTLKILYHGPLVMKPMRDLMTVAFKDLSEEGLTANILGVVRSAGELRTTRNGIGMRSYELQDEAGVVLPVTVHGSQADDLYARNTLLAIFSVVTQASLTPGEGGSAWVYDDHIIVKCGSVMRLADMTSRVDIM